MDAGENISGVVIQVLLDVVHGSVKGILRFFKSSWARALCQAGSTCAWGTGPSCSS